MPGCWILSLHLLFQLNNNLVKNKIMKTLIPQHYSLTLFISA